MMIRIAAIAMMLTSWTTATADESVETIRRIQFFRQSVEPILREHCFECHSHAAGEMNGGLTLDWRSGLIEGGGRGPAIVPGRPDDSLLVQAIRHEHADLRMPETKLPVEEIANLENWIRDGAHDPRTINPEQAVMDDRLDWWSLKPLVRPDVPQNGFRNPIDAFVFESLNKSGLTHDSVESVPMASPRTLIRRLMVDLHGLNPGPDEIASFESPAPESLSRLIDRLLESPRYGERWARHWLDTIHFADTHGFEHDELRPNAWRYRDYVIRSFNDDIPWAQFVREQLAADVLFPDQPERRAAIGFLGAGTYDRSAAATAPKNFEYLDRDDLVTQVMTSLVSTTANCARCHAHKFDPVTQEDYFALQAVFAGIGKGEVSLGTDPETEATRKKWLALQKAAESRDKAVLESDEVRQLVATWESSVGNSNAWVTLDPQEYFSIGGATLSALPDGSVLASGIRPETDVTTFVASRTRNRSAGESESGLPTMLTAIRLEVLTHESLPQQGPGRADNGNLHLNEVLAEVRLPGESQSQSLKFRSASSDFDQSGWTVAMAVDGNDQSAWGIHPEEGKSHQAIFVLDQPVNLPAGGQLRIVLRQTHGRGHVIGRFRVSVTDAVAPEATTVPDAIAEVLQIPSVERTLEQQQSLAAFAVTAVASAELRQLPESVKVYAAGKSAVNERGEIRFDQPREIRVLKRGELTMPVGEPVLPGALSAIAALPGRFPGNAGDNEGARRAALAEWIVHHDNPLTWRSIANRVWHYHFGRGLSDTPNDFGRMGASPSHPELLDWLACELRDGGPSVHKAGSLKSLHRLILTSRTWQRQSVVAPGPGQLRSAAAADPDNRLLWRMNRRRMDAETFRDSVLRICGRLDLSEGGPGFQHFSTRPGTQVTPVVDYTNFDWDKPGAARRSIYRVVWRGMPDPLMDALDFPDAAMLAPVRGESSSALQALALWNNDFVLHHCGVLAQRAADDKPELDGQIQYVCNAVLLRTPDLNELSDLVDYARTNGLAGVCRILFNSNEFLYVD